MKEPLHERISRERRLAREAEVREVREVNITKGMLIIVLSVGAGLTGMFPAEGAWMFLLLGVGMTGHQISLTLRGK